MKKNGDNRFIYRLGGKLPILSMVLVLFVSTELFGQRNINITLNDTTVEAILVELRNQSDIDFVYNHEELKACPLVSVQIVNLSFEEALQECLKNTNLEYKKVNNIFVIRPKELPNLNKAIQEVKTQTIRGRVLDRDSKASLPFANILVLNTSPQKGVTTDAEGYFKLEELPVGRYTLKFSYLGYEHAVLSELLLGSAKEMILNVELTEDTQDMDEIIVTVKKGQPLNDMATMSSKSFSVEETKRYAASVSDPARMALSFAGVATSDDASNEIVIRGNSPNWMQWRLEGVDIPSPNHFAEEGYTSGAVSILSTNTLGKSDFYTGAFPAEYGNALSGVFDIKLRKGNNEKHEYSAQIGLLGAEFAAEGPFKKGYRGSYLVNYRYATFSILNNMGIQISENALPNYQDFSFKVNLPTKKAGIFSIWGIGGISDSDEKFLPDTSLDEKLDDGYTDHTKGGMYATGISHTYFPDNRSYIKSVVAYSKSFSENQYANMNEQGVLLNDFNDDLNSGAIRLNTFYNRKVNKKLTLRAGVNLSRLNYNYFTETRDSSLIWNTAIDGSGMTNFYQAYFQSKYKLTDKILFTAGAHYSHFELSAASNLEPRLGLQIELNNQQKIGFGFGLHSKNENLPVYMVEFQNRDGSVSYLNKKLQLTRSTHYIASYEKRISQDWTVKAEVYYQNIADLPVPNNPEKYMAPAFNGISPDDTLVNAGSGRNYGVELTLQKFFTNNYYVLVTSSLFDSKYKSLDGQWRNTRYNLKYVNNFVGGKEIKWGNDKMLSLNAKILWTGGKPYIPIDLEASQVKKEAVYQFDKAYSMSTSDYFRIDLGVKLHLYKKRTQHTISIDVQNLTNRANAWYQVYDSEKEEIIEFPMAGLIPILSYRIDF